MSQTQDKLIKYCSANIAKEILSSQKLRWSSPNLFNDPLELDCHSGLTFDKAEILPAAIKSATGLIFSRDMPKGETPLINAVRRWREEDRFQTPEEAENVLRELLEKMVDARFAYLDKLLALWRNYHKKLRFCCFCKTATNVHAWNKYADMHHGVVLNFNTGEYGCFKKVSAITYGADRSEITDLREQLNGIIFGIKDKSPERFSQINLLKSNLFKNENEIRCITESPNNDIGNDPEAWYDDIKFERSDLASICFGIATEETAKVELTNLMTTEFSAAKIYQATIVKGKYEIELVKV